MERLLNIGEAAEFLNVSEMTVRRWTNQGLLKCYRVGNRRARRFNPQDLLSYIEGKASTHNDSPVSLGFNEFVVPDGSHLTHLSLKESESLEVAAAFILEGLQAGETACIVADEDKAGLIMNVLEERTPRLERFSVSGKLHLSLGLDSPELQEKYLQVLSAQAGGRFRVFGDMTWTRKKGWTTEDLSQFEKNVPDPRHAGGCLFLCQYTLDHFQGKEIMMALETHTHSIYSGRIIENPYSGSILVAGATAP
jgi:transcriptional repressor of dcmA and dcmR